MIGQRPPTLKVYAAGSLRGPLTEIAASYAAETGERPQLTFGASGLLRERIEKGETAHVFASADTQHPRTLASAMGDWNMPRVVVRNSLCALVGPSVEVTTETLLVRMLDPSVKLGTSTPGADPSGDYAWELFRKAERLHSGAYAVLDAKALKLTGSAGTPAPPAGRSTYAWNMDAGRADIFLTYCTNAFAACCESPQLRVAEVPAALQVSAAYGVISRQGHEGAHRFERHLLSAQAQQVFLRFGFAAP
ncbi:substrate-binding domain-containing protein [Polaromonas sp. YR568]|uniref:substrate-binding domain-containing protein n=1 Tax=Polaromonas sp. YR568 TaxID=1855301 RepID=UPI00313810C3